MINGISRRELRKEVGGRGLLKLEDLRRWVYADKRPLRRCKELRLAPSIIARCEAELFNLSIPRFALRLYLDDPHEGFINVRRLASFCDQIGPWGKRVLDVSLQNKKLVCDTEMVKKRPSPAWVLRTNSCIGDSVLPVPERYRDFYIVNKGLGIAYGEDKNVDGTSYLQHIQLSGGGLCAQAVCFMATTLLIDHAQGVFGIADVTYLGEKSAPRELILSGFRYDNLSRYFSQSSVGLAAVWHRPISIGGDLISRFTDSIRPYLLSGYPVILPIDAARASGVQDKCSFRYSTRSVCETNFYSDDAVNLKSPPRLMNGQTQEEPYYHTIMLVGCSKTKDPGGFVFHDPSLFPYMKATAGELLDAYCYTDQQMTNLVPGWFLPVTPGAVRMPLTSWHTPEEMASREWVNLFLSTPHYGLLDLANVLQTPRPEKVQSVVVNDAPGELRLCMTCDIEKRDLFVGLPPAARLALSHWTEGRASGSLRNRWCWVQYVKDCDYGVERGYQSIWIWDAETPPPNPLSPLLPTIIEPYLLGLLLGRGEYWEVIDAAAKGEVIPQVDDSHINSIDDVDGKEKVCCDQGPVRAVLSSFNAREVSQSIADWPDGIRHCDLYAFMQGDANRLLRSWRFLRPLMKKFTEFTLLAWLQTIYRASPIELRPWLQGKTFGFKQRSPSLGVRMPILGARHRMSLLASDVRRISRCADALACILRTINTEIVALSSFIPGLASHDPDLWHRSQGALLFLVRLASALQDRGHPCRILELVAGSLLDGVWPGKEKEEGSVYVANVLDREDAIGDFLNRLGPVAKEALTKNIGLAIELEPGPNFIINDLQSLDILCRHLNNSRNTALKRAVGLNLDVAHWSLAGITVERLDRGLWDQDHGKETDADYRSIVGRVVHSHFSDHGPGHIADVALGYIHKERYFRKWQQFLADHLAHKSTGDGRLRRPCFTLELEATKTMKMVRDSLAVLG